MKTMVSTVLAVTIGVTMTACGGPYDAPPAIRARPVLAAIAESATMRAATPASPEPATSAAVVRTPLVEARVAPPRAMATHLLVKRFVVARAVKDHEPVDADTTFKVADAGRIYAFVEVENDDRVPGEVFVSFESASPERDAGRKADHGDVKLSIGTSPRWRTWAFTRAAKDVGAWVAVVRDAHGEVLARAPFEVTL